MPWSKLHDYFRCGDPKIFLGRANITCIGYPKKCFHKQDIPCRAGSAKTLLNASAWLSSKWSPRASTSITSETILSLGAHFHAWYDGLGAFWFVVYFFNNDPPKHVQKLFPNMPVLKLNLSFWRFFSGTFKIKFPKHHCPGARVDGPSTSSKNQLLSARTHGHTDTHTNTRVLNHRTNVRSASRN